MSRRTSEASEAAAIRAWADWHGIRCLPRGRIPDAVRAAYEAAMHPTIPDDSDDNGDLQWVRRGGVLVADRPAVCSECGQHLPTEADR